MGYSGYSLASLVFAFLSLSLLIGKLWRPVKARRLKTVAVRQVPIAQTIGAGLRLLLFPVLLMIVYWVSVYVPEQSTALRRSLASTFELSHRASDSPLGYAASWLQVVTWLSLNIVFLSVLWGYCVAIARSNLENAEQTVSSEMMSRSMAMVFLMASAELIFLSPFLTGTDSWRVVAVEASLATFANIALLRVLLAPQKPWLIIGKIGTIVAISFVTTTGYDVLIAFALALLYGAEVFRVLRVKDQNLLDAIDDLLFLFGCVAGAYFSLFLRAGLHAGITPAWMEAFAATGVWLIPAPLAFLFSKYWPRPNWSTRRFSYIQVAGAFLILYSFLSYRNEIALSAVPVLLSCICAGWLALALTPEGGRLVKPVLALLALGFAGWSFVGLAPVYLEGTTTPHVSKQQDELRSFYDKWVDENGKDAPLILVAAAGGGIRAAQHTAASLAYADSFSGGEFSKHIFAISAVSGGALGTLVWISAKDEHMLPAKMPPPGTLDFSAGNVINRYFSTDFLSPSANTLLLRDLPLGAIPLVSVDAYRDDVLQKSWLMAWKKIESEQNLPSDGGRFTKPLQLQSNEFHEPLLIFNSTSAADGQRVIRSNIPVKLESVPIFHEQVSKGSLPAKVASDAVASSSAGDAEATPMATVPIMDPGVWAVQAAYDSARFPLVSAVGWECSDTPIQRDTVKRVKKACNGTFGYQTAITDGGYADNSGIASLIQIAKRLQTFGASANQIYVVFISSNPTEGLLFKEGARFESGRLTASLLAPLSMMETARAGRATSFVDTAISTIPTDHFVEWGLSNGARLSATEIIVDSKSNFAAPAAPARPFPAVPRAEETSDTANLALANAAKMPPLGWTLDETAAVGINILSISHSLYYASNCNARYLNAQTLCHAVMAQSSVKAH